MTFNAQPNPTKVSVDTIRQRCWELLKTKSPSGACPKIDNKQQAIWLALAAGFRVAEIAAGLGVSENYVRVSKRALTKRIGVEAASKAETKNEKRASAAERKRLAAIPDLDIEELHPLCMQLQSSLDDTRVHTYPLSELRKLGRDDLVQRALAERGDDPS